MESKLNRNPETQSKRGKLKLKTTQIKELQRERERLDKKEKEETKEEKRERNIVKENMEEAEK